MTGIVKQTLEQITLFTLNISLFQGSRKLSSADIKKALGVTIDTDKAKDIMSLGVKRVFDKKELAKLGAVKRAMQTACYMVGPPFFGGYAVPNDRADELAKVLEELTLKGQSLKASLLARYDDILEKYSDQNPAWKDLIRAGAFSSTYVDDQIQFAWDGIAISAGDSDGPMSKNLSMKVGGLFGDLLTDIAKAAKLLADDSLTGKSGVTRRAFKPLLKMADKLEGFNFMDARVGKLADMIRHVLLTMPHEGRIEGINLRDLVFLTSILENPDRALLLAQKAADSSVLDAYDEFFGSLNGHAALPVAVSPPSSLLVPPVAPELLGNSTSTLLGESLVGSPAPQVQQSLPAYTAPQDSSPFNF